MRQVAPIVYHKFYIVIIDVFVQLGSGIRAVVTENIAKSGFIRLARFMVSMIFWRLSSGNLTINDAVVAYLYFLSTPNASIT